MPVVTAGLSLAILHDGPGGAVATNVLAFQSMGGDFDESTMQDLTGNFAGALADHCSSGWTYGIEWTAHDLSEDPAPVLQGSSSGIVGIEDGGAMPANIAAVLSLQTGHPGRSGKGRIYIPGLDKDTVSPESTLDQDFIDGILSSYGDFAGAAVLDGWAPAVYSRKNSAVYTVEGTSMDHIVDTQRRRTERLVT